MIKLAIKKEILVLTLLFWFINLGSAQVTKVNYFVEFDSISCNYSMNIRIVEGNAMSIQQRLALNCTYSLITPPGSNAEILESFNPKVSNSNIPIVYDAQQFDSPTQDVTLFLPQINPIAFFDTLLVGDSIKLFSFELFPDSNNVTTGVRLYRNYIDDFYPLCLKQAFFIGGNTNPYYANDTLIRPRKEVTYTVDTTNNELDIDLSFDGTNCVIPATYQWHGPKGFSSTNQDIFITPFDSTNHGLYTVMVIDAMGETDTIQIAVGDSTMNYSFIIGPYCDVSANGIYCYCDIVGDDNHNSKISLEYKKIGSTKFVAASPGSRIYPNMVIDSMIIEDHQLSVEAIHLDNKTPYEWKLQVEDIDGGYREYEGVLTTDYQDYNYNLDTFYVTPGNGGGTGTLNDPYLGIETALLDNYKSIYLLALDGIYQPFTIPATESVFIKSVNLHGAIIDGGDTTSSLIEALGYHLVLDGFQLKNATKGIEASDNVRSLYIYNCKFSNLTNGIDAIFQGKCIINNNEIIGKTLWPQLNGEVPNEIGIKLSDRCTISNNTISNFGIGILLSGTNLQKVEILNNHITKIVDDAINLDNSDLNVVVFQNRIMNARTGISMSPSNGKPTFIIRNELVNFEESPLKFNRMAAGMKVYHNTILQGKSGLSSDQGWQAIGFQNNLIYGDSLLLDEGTIIDKGVYDFDYNGYFSNNIGNANYPWYRWDSIEYATLSDLQTSTSLDSNSIEVDSQSIVTLLIPQTYDLEVLPSQYNLMPSSASALVNNGTPIPNVNLQIVLDSLPDIGAYEFGSPAPIYGHDFAISCIWSSYPNMTWNGSVSSTPFNPRNWTPCGIPNNKTIAVVPVGTPYSMCIPSSLKLLDLIIDLGATVINLGDLTITGN